MNLYRTHYNQNYYENPIMWRQRASPRDRLRLEQVLCEKKGGKLLEIGCGSGEFLEVASDRFDVYGIDISPYAVNASQRVSGAHVFNVDIEKAYLSRSRYDVIAAFNVLEHLDRPDRVLNQVCSALPHEGLFIGSVPNNTGLVGSVATRIANWFDRTHRATYPPDRWRRLLVGAGFERVRFFGEITLSKARSVFVRDPLWQKVSFNLVFVCSK